MRFELRTVAKLRNNDVITSNRAPTVSINGTIGFEKTPWKLWCACCIRHYFKHLFTLLSSDIFNACTWLKSRFILSQSSSPATDNPVVSDQMSAFHVWLIWADTNTNRFLVLPEKRREREREREKTSACQNKKSNHQTKSCYPIAGAVVGWMCEGSHIQPYILAPGNRCWAGKSGTCETSKSGRRTFLKGSTVS